MSNANQITQLLRQSEAQLMILVFTHEWSGASQILIEKLNGLKREEHTFEPVYIDRDAEPELASQMNVSSVPTAILMRNHKIVGRFQGAHSRGKLLSKIKDFL